MFPKKITSVFIPFFLLITFLVLYIHNLSPSVYGGDVGDLVTAAFVGGVPHASGYPLFTFIGFCFIKIFAFFTPAFAVGLISACAGALSVVFLYLTLKRLAISRFVAVIAALSLATNYLFWFYNEIAEVFALNTFFIILLFFLAIIFAQTQKSKYFFLFLFFLGLSFTHHQTMILFVPSLLLISIPALKKQKKQWKLYLQGIGFFLLGLTPFMYIPIASAFHPVLNWDNVHDVSSFFHLILRKDYGTFSAGGFSNITFEERLIVLKSYIQTLLLELTIPVCTVSVVGIFRGIRLQRLVLLSLLLAFLLSGPLFITYAGFPLTQNFFFGVNERFFTMSAVLIFYFFALGLEEIRALMLYLKRPLYAVLIPFVFLLIPLQLFFYNFPKTDVSHVWIGDALGMDMLTPLPKHAVLFLTGDTPLFNTLYMHYAKKIRPDVDVVNFANIQMNNYMVEVQKKVLRVDASLMHQPPLLTIAMVQYVAKTRPVFSAIQIQGDKKRLIWVPFGLFYELVPLGATPTEISFTKQTNAIWQTLHIPSTQSKILGSLTISDIPNIYASAAIVVGAYFDSQYHNSEKTKAYYEKAIVIDPSNAKAYDVLGIYYLTNTKQCALAGDNFTTAMTKNPSDELSYILLYATYRECLHTAEKANALAAEFQQIFGQNIVSATQKTLSGKEKLLE